MNLAAKNAPDENVIRRVANMLSYGCEIPQIREILLQEGFSEEGVFLAIKAGETNNLIAERTYSEAKT